MRDSIVAFILCLPSLALAVGSILLAYNSLPGWGWFIFASFLLMPGKIAYTKNDHTRTDTK